MDDSIDNIPREFTRDQLFTMLDSVRRGYGSFKEEEEEEKEFARYRRRIEQDQYPGSFQGIDFGILFKLGFDTNEPVLNELEVSLGSPLPSPIFKIRVRGLRKKHTNKKKGKRNTQRRLRRKRRGW